MSTPSSTPAIPWLNDNARTFLSRDYLKPGVTPEARMREIAEAAEKILKVKGFADRFESYLHKGWYSLSSPIWSNFGAGRGLPISCNQSYIPDSLAGILEKVAEVGMMTKNGAGTSIYLGDLRARGGGISAGGSSSGPVHFAELFEVVTNVVSQSNVRRGSCAAYLPVEHPDILEFLQIRGEGHTIQHLSIGVCIGDAWMKSLIKGDKDKRAVWAKIIEKRSESGYPYIFFTDTVNKTAPKVYKDKEMKIHASNLCVAPETQILTRDGYQVIQDLENQEVKVWNGTEWSTTTIVKTNSSPVKLLKVILSNGSEIYATEYHKWFTTKDYIDQKKGIETVKRTHELIPGDKLSKFDLPVINGTENILHPYTHGAFCADGFVYEGRNRMWLYGEKHKLAQYLDIDGVVSSYDEDTKRSHVNLPDTLAPKFFVPMHGSVSCKVQWLSGFFDFDGCVVNVSHKGVDNQSLQAGSIHKVFLEEIKYLLQTLGVHAKVVDASEEGMRLMPDGHGGSKEYLCQRAWRILISSVGLFQLMNLGFAPKRLQVVARKPQRDAMQFVKVVEVIDENRTDMTYCCTEPKRGKIVLNGVLTGNCSEICLSSSKDESFVCNLSSMNLLHYEDWKDTDAVETLTYFLDAVMTDYIDKTKDIPFMGAAHRFAINQRALGIGTLGWHSYLQSKMIPFESMDAKFINTQAHKLIRDKSWAASREMAERYGEPPLLKGYGMRNVTTMAIAPTTSSSFILGQVSPSIEPENSCYYVKKLAKGSFSIRNPYLKVILAKYDKDDTATWNDILQKDGSVQHLDFLTAHEKEVFKTFGEISQKEIVIQASARQKYIDQGQSLNLMIHPKTSPKEVSQLLIQGWELGIKCFYYSRATNPAQQLGRSILNCVSCEA